MVASQTSIDSDGTGADGGGADGRTRALRAHHPGTLRGLHEGTGHRPGSVAAPHPADMRQPVPSREEALESLTVSGETPLTWYSRGITPAMEPVARRRQPLDTLLPA